jgi:DNA-binding MarR family transcriptional regulator
MREQPFGFAIADTVKSIIKKLMTRLREGGYTISAEQFAILHFLNTNQELIQQDLADFTGKDKSAILRHIDFLEENKYVLRVADPTDRRKKNLIVTKRGAELHQAFSQIDLELGRELQAGISPEDLAVFFKVLAKIKANAQD